MKENASMRFPDSKEIWKVTETIHKICAQVTAGGVVLVPELSFMSSRRVMILFQHNILMGGAHLITPKDMPALTYHFCPLTYLHFCIRLSL